MPYLHEFTFPANQWHQLRNWALAQLEIERSGVYLKGDKNIAARPPGYGRYTDIIAFGSNTLPPSIYDNKGLSPFRAFSSMPSGRWCFHRINYAMTAEAMNIPLRTREEDIPLMNNYSPPLVIAKRADGEIQVYTDCNQTAATIKQIAALPAFQNDYSPASSRLPALHPVIGRHAYLDIVNNLLTHIADGDVYEINMCVEHTGAAPDNFSALRAWEDRTEEAPQPFAAYWRENSLEIGCAGMERYLLYCPETRSLICQPIKGTARHDGHNAEQAADELAADPKERAENIMIVDLTRNDISRVCLPGSVSVRELCVPYIFPTVVQLISTVEGTTLPEINMEDILQATFPVGSMTGAPKSSAVDIIEKSEPTPRGIYSGSLGYTNPQGETDLNVIIRSFVYNQATGIISAHAGGAITIDSVPEREWEEIKAKMQYWQR